MSDIKLKVLPLFPSKTSAGEGIRIEKAGSQWTFLLDHHDFTINSSYTPKPTDNVLLFDGSHYFRVNVGALPEIITTPSTLTVYDDAAPDTVIGTVSVINGVGTYTFSLTNDAGGKYYIVGNEIRVKPPPVTGYVPTYFLIGF